MIMMTTTTPMRKSGGFTRRVFVSILQVVLYWFLYYKSFCWGPKKDGSHIVHITMTWQDFYILTQLSWERFLERERERDPKREKKMSSHGNSNSANDPRQPSAAKPFVAQMVSPQDLPVDYSGFIAVIFGVAGVMFRVGSVHIWFVSIYIYMVNLILIYDGYNYGYGCAVQAKLVACYHILCSIARQHAEYRNWSQADLHGHDVSFFFFSFLFNAHLCMFVWATVYVYCANLICSLKAK